MRLPRKRAVGQVDRRPTSVSRVDTCCPSPFAFGPSRGAGCCSWWRCNVLLARQVGTTRKAVNPILTSQSAQATRPLAGCSPQSVLERDNVPIFPLALAALEQTGRISGPSMFREALARSTPQRLHPRATGCQPAVRPNPSIERTSTGLARSTSQVHAPLRGPIRFRPAHVTR